jgi:triacylglycerol lipase
LKKLIGLFKIIFNYFFGIISELFSFLLLIITSGLDLTKSDEKSSRNSKGIPILLVHGYFHGSSAWIYLRYYLSRQNFGPIYTINLGSPFHSIEEYAELVNAKIKWISQRTGQSDIILIGHSMGGLICSYYTLYLAPKKTVKALVTLGSPLAGTKLAKIGIGNCARQMQRGSAFIEGLGKALASCEGIPFLHVGTLTDLIIRPVKSAFPNNSQAEIVKFNNLGHIGLLYSRRVGNAIVKFLNKTVHSKHQI